MTERKKAQDREERFSSVSVQNTYRQYNFSGVLPPSDFSFFAIHAFLESLRSPVKRPYLSTCLFCLSRSGFPAI